jgi:hypothetical protein
MHIMDLTDDRVDTASNTRRCLSSRPVRSSSFETTPRRTSVSSSEVSSQLSVCRDRALIISTDARLREHDPILGIISLPLVDLFSTASQVSGSYALEDGIGYGKVNISFLWKSVEIELPRELSG